MIELIFVASLIFADKWNSECISENTEYNKTVGYPHLHQGGEPFYSTGLGDR